MSKYLEFPWSVEDTIKNLKELKAGLQKILISHNVDGKGGKDAGQVAFDLYRAINALEEAQQYRAIGTLEECRDTVERQKERKPIKNDKMALWDYTCPKCGDPLIKTGYTYKFCDMCGQKLDWSDEE